MDTIGGRIRSRRQELEMSQEELASLLGYKSRSSINKIELNGRGLTQSKIKAIADALQTTPSYIMGWDTGNYKEELSKLTEDKRIDEIFNSLSPEQKEKVLSYAEYILQEAKKSDT